ncbi:hypothetical protein PMIN01_07326 [Paraphaeosphaeria minitans]|uniref:Uncharacterized protein n=1 Tax=Paraphaeosphaeria minitans TaxID=565426 RepID=A0A9P6KP94_9PLEO|nr:hypothetical protein PMIN01_07326 [Paraphaeosphaeria minitans]
MHLVLRLHETPLRRRSPNARLPARRMTHSYSHARNAHSTVCDGAVGGPFAQLSSAQRGQPWAAVAACLADALGGAAPCACFSARMKRDADSCCVPFCGRMLTDGL